MAPNLLVPIARLSNTAGIDPGNRVLDVGCGSGNLALTTSRSDAEVVGLDLSRGMLELARESAELAEEGGIDWIEGDAEELPFRDGTFDVVLSSFGHVFAPNSTAVADELVRVTRSGGRLAFTAWSPDGLVAELTDVLTDHVDQPSRDPWSHLRWGRPSFVREQLGEVAELSFQRRIARFRYVSPAHFWRDFAEEAGPLSPVISAIEDPDSRNALREDALSTLEEWFGDNVVRVAYLQVRALVD
jgi:ubiquinone/menaquinone biosynthesis C-methylase UbiE